MATDKPVSRPSLWEPITALRKVPIIENNEPLVDYLVLAPRLLRAEPTFVYRAETLLRQSVAEKLKAASEALPTAYRLAVVEGWRAPHIQARMYRSAWGFIKELHPDWTDSHLRRVVNQFTAPVTDKKVPPPHTTGAAFDLRLTDADGVPVDVITPYEPRDPAGFPFAAPNLSEIARAHRDLLRDTLAATGITNYPGEYWHYSYGDQGWAYRAGHPNALYRAITPPGWEPAPEDLLDAPLERVSQPVPSEVPVAD